MSIDGYEIGVIIPAYNEGMRIGSTLDALLNLPYIDSILVVDDGSEDNTASVAALAGANVLSLPSNQGKAFAMQKGYETMHTDILVFIDGDISEGVEQIIKLIKPICEKKADVVIARFPMTAGKGGVGLVKGLAAMGVYLLTGKTLKNILSGQRAMLRNAINKEFFNYRGFGIEFGMSVDMLFQNIKIKEVDVIMKHRTTGRDIRGFVHRYHQFKDILRVILSKMGERIFSRKIESMPKEQD